MKHGLMILGLVLTILMPAALSAGSPVCSEDERDPVPVLDLVYARPFALDQSYATRWRKERLQVRSGWLVVLDVRPDLVLPRATRQPVLFAGDHTVEILRLDQRRGRVAGIVPEETDLSTVPFWFGDAAYPEQVDAGFVRRNRLKAERAGIKPPSAEALQLALERGGGQMREHGKSSLFRSLESKLGPYFPQESTHE